MSYPEHEKLRKVREESQVQGELLEWLSDELGLTLCETRPEPWGYHPTRLTTQALLARYHDIDEDKLRAEKDAMLEEIRSASNAT